MSSPAANMDHFTSPASVLDSQFATWAASPPTSPSTRPSELRLSIPTSPLRRPSFRPSPSAESPSTSARWAANGPSSPVLRRASEQGRIDPLTLHTLARGGTESDALRAVEARADRARVLNATLDHRRQAYERPSDRPSIGPIAPPHKRAGSAAVIPTATREVSSHAAESSAGTVRVKAQDASERARDGSEDTIAPLATDGARRSTSSNRGPATEAASGLIDPAPTPITNADASSNGHAETLPKIPWVLRLYFSKISFLMVRHALTGSTAKRCSRDLALVRHPLMPRHGPCPHFQVHL